MNSANRSPYVLLPCSGSEAWAIPQNCLGEIVTVPDAQRQPPEHISWRGLEIPVLDRGLTETGAWRDSRGETGLVAVLLALGEAPGDCWGLAVSSEGPAIAEIAPDEIEEMPETVAENASSAFRFRGVIYQVPDLRAWQAAVAGKGQAA
jgi:hypothetical protein